MARFLVAVACAGIGCGDNEGPPPLTPDELVARLRALGVTVEEPPDQPADLRYYVLRFTQPIDHDDPSRGTFLQRVSLLHRNEQASVPMIVYTSGYADAWGDRPVELTRLLAANQVSIEHRFFGESRPDPADWTRLTIAQAAADHHAVIQALRTIYGGAFLTTGNSKAGMTAVFHRRFYPDDVDGTVAYVAPISFGAPDRRYGPFLGTIGPPDCRAALRAAAVDMLANRRDAISAFAEQQGHAYTRISLGAAVEAAIVGLEWTFWQYKGVTRCASVPTGDASDEEVFRFLDDVSPVTDNDDKQLARFEPYYYQSYSQLGYPDSGAEYLLEYQAYTASDYLQELPTDVPAYDSSAMRDIDDFVEHQGDRLLFIYGAWDPWTAGKFVLGNATNSAMLLQAEGTHRAQISSLESADRDVAYALIEEWTGVAPNPSLLGRQKSGVMPGGDDPEARMPPALVRALTTPK